MKLSNACAYKYPPSCFSFSYRVFFVRFHAQDNETNGAGAGTSGGGGVTEHRVVDDRLQRPVRKLVRERHGIRVLMGLLRYRRQAAMADTVRLRAALCLLGLAHDHQIAQVLRRSLLRCSSWETRFFRGYPR